MIFEDNNKFQIGDHQDSEIKSFYPDGTERSDAAYRIQKSKKASTKQDSTRTSTKAMRVCLNCKVGIDGKEKTWSTSERWQRKDNERWKQKAQSDKIRNSKRRNEEIKDARSHQAPKTQVAEANSNMRGGSEDETSQSILAKTLRLVVRTKTKTKNHQNKKTHKIHTSSSIPPYPKAPPIGDDEGDGGCAGGWDGVLLALLSFTRWISSQLRLFLYLLNIPRSRPIIPNSKAYPRVS
ncbi:hypothetical protein C8J56DRAFT_899248 [Mycena floridula]|nr:hypothetical protein C8J56DRAFT_899248 [Mycena floridula]